MKKYLFIFALSLLAAISSHAQGIRFTAPILQRGTIAGATNAVILPITPIVSFCNAPANAAPCTNKATTYTDATLSTPCLTSTQIVLDGTTNCVASPDANDNWGVWIAPNSAGYAYTIQVAGATLGPYYVLQQSTSAAISNIAGPGSIQGTFSSGPQIAIASSPIGATETGNNVTITTTTPCSFLTGQIVTISNVTLVNYNGSFQVLAPGCNGGSSFTYNSQWNSLAASGNGTVTGSPTFATNAWIQGLTVTGTGVPLGGIVATNLLNVCGNTGTGRITLFSVQGSAPCTATEMFFGGAPNGGGYKTAAHQTFLDINTGGTYDVASALAQSITARCGATNAGGTTNDNATNCTGEAITAQGMSSVASQNPVGMTAVGTSLFTGNGSHFVQANQALISTARTPGWFGDVLHDYGPMQTNVILGGSQSITSYMGMTSSQNGAGALIGEFIADSINAGHAIFSSRALAANVDTGYWCAASTTYCHFIGAGLPYTILPQYQHRYLDSPVYGEVFGEKAANSGQSNVQAMWSTNAGTSATLVAAPNGAVQSDRTITYTTTAAHGFSVGQIAHITGAGAGYSFDCPILTTPLTTTFTCNTSITQGDTFTISNSPTGASESGTTVTITTTVVCSYTTGQMVTIANVTNPNPLTNNGYNGTFTVLAPGCNGGSSFTYTNTLSGLAASGAGTVVGAGLAAGGGGTVTASTRQGWNHYVDSSGIARWSFASPPNATTTDINLSLTSDAGTNSGETLSLGDAAADRIRLQSVTAGSLIGSNVTPVQIRWGCASTCGDLELASRGGSTTDIVFYTAAGAALGEAGRFTTGKNLTVVGSITPSQAGGIVGTTTNNNANAGSVGEFVSSVLATGSSVTLSTGATSNVTSISLTAGDWDVSGAVDFTFGATTSYTNLIGSISTTTGTIGGQDSKFDFETPAAVPTAAADATFPLPVVRLSLSGTTTVFLVAQGTFTVSTLKAYGTIQARRMR